MRDAENRDQRMNLAAAGTSTDPFEGAAEMTQEENSELGPRKSRKKYTWKRYASRRSNKLAHRDGSSPNSDDSGESVIIEEAAEKGRADVAVLPSGSRSGTSGEAAAVLLSILLCMTALTAAHWWSAAAPSSANPKLLWLASWVPSGLRIGPYAGKEVAAGLVWLVSWALLHSLLRGRAVSLQRWLYGFIAAVLLMLILLWPPIYHAMFGWPA